MTYAQYGLIQSLDYNTLVGNTVSSTANTFNATWATGSGSAGYGQQPLTQVAVGDTVADANWANLINRAANVSLHQATTSYTTITAPAIGDKVSYLSSLPTNLQLIYTQRLNASVQGSTVANSVATSQTWTDKVVWKHTVTFANGDAARYFFNSGGQLKMACSHPTGLGINLLLNNLASNVGTVTMSSPASGTVKIVGTNFSGITKVGGGGTAPTIAPNNGYYALTTANVSVFTQTASTGPSSYLSTNINYTVVSNGPQGANGDKGSIITIYTTWDEIPNGLTVSTGSTVTCTVAAPETTYIANTWGAVAVSGIIQSIV